MSSRQEVPCTTPTATSLFRHFVIPGSHPFRKARTNITTQNSHLLKQQRKMTHRHHNLQCSLLCILPPTRTFTNHHRLTHLLSQLLLFTSRVTRPLQTVPYGTPSLRSSGRQCTKHRLSIPSLKTSFGACYKTLPKQHHHGTGAVAETQLTPPLRVRLIRNEPKQRQQPSGEKKSGMWCCSLSSSKTHPTAPFGCSALLPLLLTCPSTPMLQTLIKSPPG